MSLETRPAGWQCPWCDSDEFGNISPDAEAQAVDFSLPLELRICDACAHPQYGPRLPDAHEEALRERVDVLRAILRRHVRESFSEHDEAWVLSAHGRKAWAWMQAGAAFVGNALLQALSAYGLDPAHELTCALNDVSAENLNARVG